MQPQRRNGGAGEAMREAQGAGKGMASDEGWVATGEGAKSSRGARTEVGGGWGGRHGGRGEAGRGGEGRLRD
jgi:hypothetical protein